MVIIPAIKAGAAVITSVIVASSSINIYETYSISKQGGGMGNGVTNLDSRLKAGTTEDIVSELTNMKRRELIELFLVCDAPADINSVSGEWNGLLLENNGRVMTSVASFMTHRLFGGMNKKWCGKKFNKQNAGINNFHPLSISSPEEIKKSLESKHVFDLITGPSNLKSDQKSLILQYRDYQSPFSLWRTMQDEVRILRLDDGAQVLIAIGYMAWSGGVFTATPFCLYKPSDSCSS